MVECTGLENRRAARYRGFESPPLRNKKTARRCGERNGAVLSLLKKTDTMHSRVDEVHGLRRCRISHQGWESVNPVSGLGLAEGAA